MFVLFKLNGHNEVISHFLKPVANMCQELRAISAKFCQINLGLCLDLYIFTFYIIIYS